MRNRILFYCLFLFLTYKPYGDSRQAGWAGYYEWRGKALAFQDIDGKLFFDF